MAVFVVSVLLSLGFVSAWVDCYEYGPFSAGGTPTGCVVAGCVVTSEDGLADGYDGDVVFDSQCGSAYSDWCCLPKMCWQWDATSESVCNNNDGTLNCTWNGYPATIYYQNGSSFEINGTCYGDWTAMGDGEFGGAASGCWQYNGDNGQCTSSANSATCQWKENDANQNPWCGIHTLGDAQMQNSFATTNDIGCCEQKGCWSYDGNETLCVNNTAFPGACTWGSKASDPWCPNDVGCCYTKSCYDAGSNDTLCNILKTQMMMPCTNESGTCQDMAGGGFMFFDDSDSCFNQGGWYNSTGGCVMPSGDDFGAGAGGFMFGGEAHCWFADNQPLVCGNITGCAYCESGSGPNGIDNATDNICYRKVAGYCEGRNTGEGDVYDNANNSVNLACAHMEIKSACNYGPLPNCVWNSSANLTGAFCSAGASSVVKSAPPVGFCEHPDSKNNYTLCTQLIEEYMMPCVWDNSSTIVKNCTFNPSAVFGFGGESDLGGISSDTACTASGGTWQTEYYIENDILKQDSWCEMTGFFNIDDGGGEGNKGNCDTSCWACEFQGDGTSWTNGVDAEAACVGSDLGYCTWTNDSTNTSAFNGFGWCDYPQEMELGGSGDCNTDCENCNFVNSPEVDCESSVAECKWINDSAGGGSCVDVSKKTCDNDCFSCYSSDSCYDSESDVSCEWDYDFALCKPQSYSGEICFNGFDDDGDGMVDCGDPDCGFDNFCGGSAFGGDCFAQMSEGECNTTFAFELGGEDLNCTWVTNDWETEGHCDMPGSNCWQYDSNLSACGEIPGCTNDSSSMMIGGSSMCDINMTLMDSVNCWQYDANETYCSEDGGSNCQWVNDSWCESNPDDSWCSSVGGWCDFKPFATCMGLNSTSCGDNSNCTWKDDSYSMMGGDGWCDVACFNPNLNETTCNSTGLGNICEYRDMSATCQPEMFMMMGMGSGGQTGCWQYDGNETGCMLSGVTCQYKNDSYANNNLTGEFAGWCMDKAEFEHFGDMKGDVIELAMDSGNGFGQQGPEAEIGVSGEVDLMGMGMRVTDEGFNFGVGVYNISKGVVCNGYMVGAGMGFDGSVNPGTMGVGSATTKFYWYLDTDGNESGGCFAYGGGTHTGYEFMIQYISSNETGNIVETKKLMKCNSGDSSWVSTNVLITTSKQMSCGEIQGVMVAVEKQGLESFAEYDKTANMRIFMASSNGSDSRSNPSDYIGPGYYTPGMIDFGFVDCSDPNTKDPKCKNMQKFGFNVFEECMNGVDDDEDGLIDCYDPMCLFSPNCASAGNAFAFVAVDGDNTAPTVMFSKIDALSDGAFMKIDTNEPSNLSVSFYYNDSTCTVLNPNTTIDDVGVETYQAYSNFKPFHAVDLISDNLGYALSSGTAYYYKIKVCDPSGNCAVSACSNFTTKTGADKQFIFKLDLPPGYTVDIPALNKTGYNFTETFTINDEPTTFDVGIKTNTSVTKNMNITVHSNCGSGLSIGFYGINIFEPITLDMSNAFVCNASTNMMGMNSSLKKWNTLIDKMYLGGATDYIEMNMPVAYSSANTFNFVDDTGAGAKDVDDYVNCASGGTGVTACKVPVSLGF